MKKICRNCGAKVPKKSDICPKCGEPYEYIDMVRLDPELEKNLNVEKPSVMINVCLIILSVLVIAYAALLGYNKYTEQSTEEENSPSEITADADPDVQISEAETPAEPVLYNAVDFIGKPFSDVKKVLGDKYSIKLSDTTLVAYTDVPVTLSTLDFELTDESVISKVIITGNGQITPAVTADMTFDDLKIVLGFKANAPELNEEDAYYYVREKYTADAKELDLVFRFDDEATDRAPMEVTVEDSSLIVKKVMATVTGLDDFLNLRSEPSYSSDALLELVNGDEVEIIDTYKADDGTEWYQVIYDDRITGYAAAEFIVKNEEIKNIAMFETNNDDTDEDKNSDEDSDSDSDDDEESDEE